MPPKLLAPTNVEIEADGLDLVHACCARLGIPDRLRDAIGMRLGVAADFSVQFLAPLTDAERTDTVENVVLVHEANEPRLPTLFEKSQIRSLFWFADIVAASLLTLPWCSRLWTKLLGAWRCRTTNQVRCRPTGRWAWLPEA